MNPLGIGRVDSRIGYRNNLSEISISILTYTHVMSVVFLSKKV
jgi:hypothetical protein